jgi:uncharacterized protein YecA (UPF0149 family)
MEEKEYEYSLPEGYEKLMEEALTLKYGRIPKKMVGVEIKPVRDSKTDPKIGRNEQCPCGSGNKFKKCCIK